MSQRALASFTRWPSAWARGLKLSLALLGAALTSCTPNEEPTSGESTLQASTETRLSESQASHRAGGNKAATNAQLRQFIEVAQTTYRDALAEAEQLKLDVGEFGANPNADTLQRARQQWLRSHDAYALTSVFRKLPLSHPELDRQANEPEVMHSISVRLDRRPIIPGYLDEVDGYPKSGLMYSDTPLDFVHLNQEHQFSDPYYVTLGFHALEFMLWGETEAAAATQLSRYIPPAQGADEELLQVIARRKHYCAFLAQQIARDMRLLYEAWSSDEAWYPAQLLSAKTAHWQSLINRALEREAQRLLEDYHPDFEHSYRRLDSQAAREALYLRLSRLFSKVATSGSERAD